MKWGPWYTGTKETVRGTSSCSTPQRTHVRHKFGPSSVDFVASGSESGRDPGDREKLEGSCALSLL